MEKETIKEYINNGAIHYLRLLAEADHMVLEDDGFCTLIHPKEGEEGGTSVFNFRFDGMTDEEIERKILQIKEKNIHTFYGCYPPENVKNILMKSNPKTEENEEDSETYMAILPHEKPVYNPPKPPVSAKKVDNLHDFIIWADISNKVLHGGYAIMHPKNHYHLLECGKMQCYLGFYDRLPVSTAAIMNDNSIASLEFVATLKDYRKKGAGGAACRIAVEEAFNNGAAIISLRGFTPGKALYRSIGFKVY